jgi:hypothetical protein
MALKSKVTTASDLEYPKIMKSTVSGAVVLFSTPSYGVVLIAGTMGSQVGEYGSTWDRDLFVDYNESVLIGNLL